MNLFQLDASLKRPTTEWWQTHQSGDTVGRLYDSADMLITVVLELNHVMWSFIVKAWL